MVKSKKYILSVEVYKYPYCGRLDDTEDYLSNKICCYTIKIRKKVSKKVKLLIVYGDLILRLANSVASSQAIGLPPPSPIMRMRSIHSNASLSKEAIIALVSKDMSAKNVFTKTEMEKLYDLSVKCRDNSISRHELITQITNLRGGTLGDILILAAFGVIGGILFWLGGNETLAFQPNPNVIVPPHLQLFYGNHKPENQFGYGKSAGPRRSRVIRMTQNAGSEKKQPSSSSYDYIDIMRELKKQSNKQTITIVVADQKYVIKKDFHGQSPYELSDKLAKTMYESIRKSDTDICDIAGNLGFKANNIKNIKDHVFINKHYLDRYGREQAEFKRFDPDFAQALAWKRLEAGIHVKEDIIWIKHECAERHNELKYNSGYSEAHNRAERFFPGSPWDTNWEQY